MKTKQAAILKYRSLYTLPEEFLVYQYERGHWGYATADSPVGQNLINHGMISVEANIPCRSWEFAHVVTIDRSK